MHPCSFYLLLLLTPDSSIPIYSNSSHQDQQWPPSLLLNPLAMSPSLCFKTARQAEFDTVDLCLFVEMVFSWLVRGSRFSSLPPHFSISYEHLSSVCYLLLVIIQDFSPLSQKSSPHSKMCLCNILSITGLTFYWLTLLVWSNGNHIQLD